MLVYFESTHALHTEYNMKKIIITGCNGQLGREINKLYEGSTEYELVKTDFKVEGVRDLDITNLDACLDLFREVKQ